MKTYKHYGEYKRPQNVMAVKFSRLPHLPLKKKFRDTADCMICGKSYVSVPSHACQTHRMYLKEYLLKYGDIKVFGDDYKTYLEVSARKAGKSEEASIAREKYWRDQENVNKKSVWMIEEFKRRMENKEFAERWHNRKRLKEFAEESKKRFEEINKLKKNCKRCGKEFSPGVYIDKNGYIKHKETGRKWKQKHYCSKECRYLDSRGKPKSKAHRLALSMARIKYLENVKKR